MERTTKLEYKLLFAIVVAGKSAKFAQAAMERFRGVLSEICPGDYGEAHFFPWFRAIRRLSDAKLKWAIFEARLGNYRKVVPAFRAIAESYFDLATCSVEQLELIKGIGPKTSRFFLLWTRPDARVAALDVHVLRWLREQGYDIPARSPSGKQYAEIEQIFLLEADKRGITAQALDRQIWLGANKSGIRS